MSENKEIKELGTSEPEKLIEQNIFEFFKIISGRLFYYIGNSKNKTLVHVSCDGNDRREWPLYITDVHFEQGGWLYFTRKSGYNAILCKSRLDGTRFSIIACMINRFHGRMRRETNTLSEKTIRTARCIPLTASR